jgi:uncharacterized protein (TIGR03067 family)
MIVTLVVTCLISGDLGAVADRPSKKDPRKEDLKKLQGTWEVVSYLSEGIGSTFKMHRTISGNQWTTHTDGQPIRYRFEIDPTKKPKTIDILPVDGPLQGKRLLCIYEVDGDTLKLCQAQADKPRPTKFTGDAGSGCILTVAKRAKAK